MHVVIKLHDRQISFITIIWKPFKVLLANFRQSMDVRTSVIDSFATFFFLSHIKILSITSDLLIPTRIYQLGSNILTLGLFYSPTIVYFGEEHLPHAILAIFISIVIFLYPHNPTSSLSFSILSKVSFPLSLQLALPPCLC